jgi:hypothetical protein
MTARGDREELRGLVSRQVTLVECVPVPRPKKFRRAQAYYLIDEEHEDVLISTKNLRLGTFEFVILMQDNAVIIIPSRHEWKEVRGHSFVSAKALIEIWPKRSQKIEAVRARLWNDWVAGREGKGPFAR